MEIEVESFALKNPPLLFANFSGSLDIGVAKPSTCKYIPNTHRHINVKMALYLLQVPNRFPTNKYEVTWYRIGFMTHRAPGPTFTFTFPYPKQRGLPTGEK